MIHLSSPRGGRGELVPNTVDFKGGPPHTGTLGVHQNIPASDTKLTPSLDIYYIIRPLAMDKLIPGNSRAITSSPKMNLLLEVQHTPAVFKSQRLILATNTDNYIRPTKSWSITKTFDQQKKMLNQYLKRIVSSPDARQGRSRIAPQTAVQLTRSVKSIFLLTH